MQATIQIGRRLVIAFAVTTALTLVLGLVAFKSVSVLTRLIEDLHNHPLTVSNALSNASYHVLAIHRIMNSLERTLSESDLRRALQQSEAEEAEALHSLRMVHDRFLGDKDLSLKALQAVHDWNLLHEKAFSLMLAGQTEAADRIIRGKGEEQLSAIEGILHQLTNTARLKAEAYRSKSRQTSDAVIWYLGVLLLMIIPATIGLAIFTTRKINTQIDEFQLASDALQENEQRFRATIDNAIEAIITCDSQGDVTAWNQGAQSTFGYTPDEMMGQPLTLIMPERYRLDHQKGLQRVASGGPVKILGKVLELNGLGKDGIEFPIEFSVASWLSGGEIYFTAVIRNITEQKRLREELAEHHVHLHKLVDERTAQLETAVKAAESANRAKSDFLANMSHEIRTPMNAVIGLTQLMQQAETTPEQQDRLAKIGFSAQHLLSIINNILDISKIEAGKLTLERRDFSLDSLIDNIQSMFASQVKTKGLSIKTDLTDVPRWLRGDITRVRQSLLNYMSNAVKFTQQGSILLRVTRQDKNDDGVLLRFEVTDTGIGIDANRLGELFKAFEQADKSTTRKHGGTGLGLVITRRLAHLMGGDAGAQSEAGKGSTFWFTARLALGQGVIPTSPANREASTGNGLATHHRGCRVLLAEDNAINCEVAVALLRGAELEVETAENGRVAVELIGAKDFDLVLMDIQMPEMDGLEATRLIRAMQGKENLPILAMTANVFEDDRRACQEAGMNDFVAKPIELEAMFETLAKWLPGQNHTHRA